MASSRHTVRDKIVELLTLSLVGTGLPVKTVTGNKPETLEGATPLVAVLSTGTHRQRLTYQGDVPVYSFIVTSFVLQSATGWTSAEAEDAVDDIEAIIAGVVESNRSTEEWALIEYSSPTQVVEAAVAGTPYYIERIPIHVHLCKS